MRQILAGLLVVGWIGLAAPAFADEGSEDCTICSGTTSDSWGVKTTTTLTRGMANTGLCWMELFRQPMREAKNNGNVLVGCGKGVGHTFIRLCKGIGEIVTSPLPKAKDGSQIATNCPVCMWQA